MTTDDKPPKRPLRQEDDPDFERGRREFGAMQAARLDPGTTDDKPSPAPTDPCPFWDDGKHCWREESISGGVRLKSVRSPGPSAGVKSCACGAEVFGKTAPRG